MTRSPGRALLLVLACLLPHLLRADLSVATYADGFYAHAALMFSQGYEPYVDFTQVAFPFADRVMGWAVGALGHDARVLEWVNNVVVLVVALLLARAGRRLAGSWAGVVAALAWSWCTWVVHFNLFERETWAAMGTAGALAAYLGCRTLTPRRAALVALGLLVAFGVKITAVMPAFALCAHLALQRRWRSMWRLGLMVTAGVVGLTLACAATWGAPFLWQVFVFGFFRHQLHSFPEALAQVAAHTDLFMLVGWISAAVYGLRRLREPIGAVVLVLAADLFYATVISPVVWNHNMINLAVPLALLAGCGVDRALSRDAGGAVARRVGLGLTLATAAIVALLAVDVFGETRFLSGWVGRWKPSQVGFGFFAGRPRAEIEAQAAFVRRHTEPDDLIECVEPWVAFQAGRVKFVRYWDLQPVAMGVAASLSADGLVATLGKRRDQLLIGPGRPAADPRVEQLKDPYIARLAANALAYVRPPLMAALAAREIALVLEPLPAGIITADDLLAAGYRRIEEDGLAAWLSGSHRFGRAPPVYPRD